MAIRKILGVIGHLAENPLFLVATRKRGGVVLVYHRVAPEADPFYQPIHPILFKHHISLVKNYFEIIPLEELVMRHQSGRSLRGCCSITFDDGYSDFQTYAYPVLKELQVPVTHFVTSDGLLKGSPTWNYRLNRLLHYIQLSADLNHSKREGDLPTWAEILRITKLISAHTSVKREEILGRLEQECTLPPTPPMLSPQDLHRMDKHLIQWGSHTVSHTSLVGCNNAIIKYELAHSRDMIENVLGRRVRFLSYPNGHFDSLTMKTAAECGYLASFAVGQNRVMPETSLHGIPRFDVSGLPPNMLGLELAGLTPALRGIKVRIR